MEKLIRNYKIFYSLLFCIAVSYINIIFANECPELGYLKFATNIHNNNNQITCFTDIDFCFQITSLQLQDLQKTPDESPATALLYIPNYDTTIGIIINKELISTLKKMNLTANKNGSYNKNNRQLYHINQFSPLVLWNKTDPQNLNSCKKEIIMKMNNHFSMPKTHQALTINPVSTINSVNDNKTNISRWLIGCLVSAGILVVIYKIYFRFS